MNNFFNIALIPEDEELARTCIQLAKINLKNDSDQYLLGNNAHPHVTLCEFIATEEQLDQIWSSVKDLQLNSLPLSFGHIYILPGRGIHAGKIWVGLTVIKTTELIKLQKSVCEKLLPMKIESKTKIDGYTPHLTWGRCDGNKPITIAVMPPQELWQKPHAFDLSLGRSDINGAYQEQLFSNSQPDLAKRSVT